MDKKVILFGAVEWCASCRKMKPTFKNVANELANENITFSDIDVETEEGVELSTKYEIRNVPTIIVVLNDKIVKRISGTRTEKQLIDDIKSVV